ncbi:MAG: hypothetical protein R3B48_23270 [Kofleriaceae bacterium]
MIMSHACPRLREDLVAEAIEDQGARFIDVIDPDTGSSFRFYDVEYALACAMDGERDVPGLVQWAQEELGIVPSDNELRTVISTLGELGYLDAVGADVQPATTPPDGAELGAAHAEPFARPAPEAAFADVLPEPSTPGPFATPGIALPSLPTPSGPGLPRAGSRHDAESARLDPARDSQRGLGAPPAGRDSQRGLGAPLAGRDSQRGLGAPPAGRDSQRAVAAQRPSDPLVSRPSPWPAAEPKPRPSEPKLWPLDAKEPESPSSVSPMASDPSLNLSLPIRPDDVKEAVRASREMRAVDVPSDLMQALEAAERPAPPRRASSPAVSPAAPPPMPEVRPPPPPSSPLPAFAPPPPSSPLPAFAPPPPSSPLQPPTPPSLSAAVLDPIAPLPGARLSVSEPISPPSVPPLVPIPRVESPIEQQESRPALAPAPRDRSAPIATPVAAPPPQRSSAVWLVVILVLAILGVVGFGAWKFFLKERFFTTAPVSQPTTPPPAADVPEAPPPPPAEVTAKLSLVKGSPVSIKMEAAGTIQAIVAEGAVLSVGEEVAQLGGRKAVEQRIADAKNDLEKRYPADLARIKAKLASAAGNKAATARYTTELTNREARVTQRSAELEAYQQELAKLSLTTEVAGKVTSAAKVGARLGAGAEVATVEPSAYLSGAANYGAPVSAKQGDDLVVKLRQDPAATSTCTVETVQGALVAFRCPLTDGFADGVEVLLDPK